MNLRKFASDANLQWLVLTLGKHNVNEFEELMLDLKMGSTIIQVISECQPIKDFLDEFLINPEKFTLWKPQTISYFKSRCEVVYFDAMKINRHLKNENELRFPNSKKDWQYRYYIIKKIKNFWLETFLRS